MTRRPTNGTRRTIISLRVLPSELKDIDRRARAHQMTRTDYLIRSALGITTDPSATEARLDDIEARLDRVERLTIA